MENIMYRITGTESQGDGNFRFRLTGTRANRVGDTTNVEGLETPDSLPMLWNHEKREFPLGRWSNFSTDAEGIYADAYFDPGDELAQTLQGKVERGVVTNVSVGIAIDKKTPLEPQNKSHYQYGVYRGPVHVERGKLLEASFVNTPADNTAVRVRSIDNTFAEIWREEMSNYFQGS